MSTTRTPSQRAKANGDKGKRAERAVVDAFLTAGFPDARRAVATGTRSGSRVTADPGDLAGIPHTVVSVKDCEAERLPAWIAELDVMATSAAADWALLVVKRRGHADASRWWCWCSIGQLAGLIGPWDTNARLLRTRNLGALIRLELGVVLPLLRHALDDDHARGVA